MFFDLDWPTNASSPLSASAELLVNIYFEYSWEWKMMSERCDILTNHCYFAVNRAHPHRLVTMLIMNDFLFCRSRPCACRVRYWVRDACMARSLESVWRSWHEERCRMCINGLLSVALQQQLCCVRARRCLLLTYHLLCCCCCCCVKLRHTMKPSFVLTQRYSVCCCAATTFN